jgi:hypothetical protein
MSPFLAALLRLLGKKGAPAERMSAEPAPVSDALDVETSPHEKPLTDALAAIDAVHKDGQLPKIPIKRLALSRGMHGRFLHVIGGRPLEIAVHPASRYAALTAVHEIGHFLDYAGLGDAGGFCSVSGNLLGGWRSAVRNSDAVQRLGRLWRFTANKAQEAQADGDMVKYKVEQKYIEYLLQPEELWARSYAQFIAVRSAHPALREQMDRLRDRPARRLYYGMQWDDEDFLPIMAQIEAVFRQIGWMQ